MFFLFEMISVSNLVDEEKMAMGIYVQFSIKTCHSANNIL